MNNKAYIILFIMIMSIVYTNNLNSKVLSNDLNESIDIDKDEYNETLQNESENEEKKVFNNENELLKSLYGKWLYKEDNSWALKITEETIIITLDNSSYKETKTYELIEANLDENYIIVNITREYIPSEGEGEDIDKAVNYFEKYTLEDDEIECIYKYNVENERAISLWIKESE